MRYPSEFREHPPQDWKDKLSTIAVGWLIIGGICAVVLW